MRKIVDLTHIFDRYCDDVWYFAALLANGVVIGFSQLEIIDDVYGTFYLLDSPPTFAPTAFGKEITVSVTSRERCLIKLDQIVAIQEISET